MNVKYYENGKLKEREMTPEEQAQMEAEARLQTIEQNRRPFTEKEVLDMLIPMQINELAVDDNTAFRMSGFYPCWEVNTQYQVNYKVQDNGKLYKVIQAHTSQEGWQPENTPSLFEQINETYTGELTDPIPYSGNMALENGKYYIQDNAIYLCIRDTVNPVHNVLSDLVGIYLEIV